MKSLNSEFEGVEEEETHEFTDDAFVDKDGNGDAEDADKEEVPASPAEIDLEILSGRCPIFNELVLVGFHSSTHLRFLRSNAIQHFFFFFFSLLFCLCSVLSFLRTRFPLASS